MNLFVNHHDADGGYGLGDPRGLDSRAVKILRNPRNIRGSSPPLPQLACSPGFEKFCYFNQRLRLTYCQEELLCLKNLCTNNLKTFQIKSEHIEKSFYMSHPSDIYCRYGK